MAFRSMDMSIKSAFMKNTKIAKQYLVHASKTSEMSVLNHMGQRQTQPMVFTSMDMSIKPAFMKNT